MSPRRVAVIATCAAFAAWVGDLAYQVGRQDERDKLDAATVDLPVDDAAPDSDIDPESDTDTQG